MTTDIEKIKGALKSPRIKNTSPSELVNYLVKTIGIVFAIKGAEIETDNTQ